MLARDFLRTHFAEMPHLLRNRTFDPGSLARWGELDAERRRVLTAVEAMKAERNALSAEVGRKKKAKEDATAEMERAKELGVSVSAQEKRVEEIEGEFFAIEQALPNVPHESVPEGEDETGNAVLKTWGEPGTFSFTPKPHWELGDGPRHPRLRAGGQGDRGALHGSLGRGLAPLPGPHRFMLDLHTREHGYREVLPPFIVNAASLFGTGQLPKFEADLFRLQGTDWYLAPTAEVPVTNLHRDEVLRDDQLTISYCAYTPCFRAEAGAAGKDTRGLIRQHQFDKVELVKFTRAEDSAEAHEKLTRGRRDRSRAARAAVPARRPLPGRHGVLLGEDLRPRGLAPGAERLPGDLLLLELRGVSGAEGRDPREADGRGRQVAQRVRPHAQRVGPGGGADPRRDPRELPAGRRLGGDPGGPPAVLRGALRDSPAVLLNSVPRGKRTGGRVA